MTIVIFSQFHPPEMEPSGFMFASLSKSLAKNHEVHLISGFANFPAGKFRDKPFFKVFASRIVDNYRHENVLVVPSSNKNNITRVFNYLSYMIMSFFRAIFIRNVDKIVVTSPPIFSAVSALLLSKLKKVPYILDVRDIWPESAVQMGSIKNRLVIRFFEWIETKLYLHAESILVATPGMVPEVEHKLKKLGVEDKEVNYIPCGIHVFSDDEITQFKHSNPLRPEDRDKFVVLYAGLHGHAQNLRVILDAALMLKDHEDIIFYLIGDGPEKDDLIRYKDEKSISNVIFFDAFERDKIRSAYANVDLGLVPLRDLQVFKTVFPSKTFELMSFGVPIIVGVGGQIEEMIIENECGVCVKPDCSNDYAQSILTLYENKSLRELMSKNARLVALNNFDYSVLNARMEDIITRVERT